MQSKSTQESWLCQSSNGDLLFGYDQMHKTHQPRTMYDPNNGTLDLYWDANGNLAQVIGCKQNSGRLHEWDEENRLRFVLGEKYAGYYGYNADGERVYKLTGMSVMDQVNSGSTKAQAIFDEAVLYPNPYMVVTRKGYTKHYYANGERLATSIGQGGWCYTSPDVVSHPVTEHEAYLQKYWSEIFTGDYPFEYPKEPIPQLTKNVDIDGRDWEELQYRCPIRHLQRLKTDYEPDILLATMQSYCEAWNQEKDIFYTHGDHLGSTNWITSAKW